MSYDVTNLADAIASGEFTVNDFDGATRNGVWNHICTAPSCGHQKPAFSLVDVRHVEGIEGDFVCDVCWSHVKRHLW